MHKKKYVPAHAKPKKKGLLLPILLPILLGFLFLGVFFLANHADHRAPLPEKETAAASITPVSSQMVPVLMYHHFQDRNCGDGCVSAKNFEAQMKALHDAGFHAIRLKDLRDYAEEGTPLPEKPFLITMDDGYTSNLTEAAPILEKYGMHAAVFVIGINEGEPFYVHTGEPFYSERFSFAEAKPWVDKDVLEIQCHTYDLHQRAEYGCSGRDGVRKLPEETEEDYRKVLKEDLHAYRVRQQGKLDGEVYALAYPLGYYTETAEAVYREEGIGITFTTDARSNRIEAGNPDSLRLLGRYPITDRMTGTDVVNLIADAHGEI